jgi:dienelactone hydrolase
VKRIFFAAFTVIVGWQLTLARDFSGPWDMKALSVAPKVTWGVRSNLVQEVFYESEPFKGHPTHVFAYVGRPEGVGPFPAVVLVHGGGGKAFYDWADHWARRGYVSISMDTAGVGPNGRLSDGGPDQSDEVKFRNFTRAEIQDMWTYHAVADAIRAHSLLLSLPEVDRKRTALTGISWGGYLTCIIAGIDHRFKAAVPVYGCGFLGEDSYWKDKSLAAMNPDARALWLETFDPSKYLSGVSCPILFFNGTHDFAYPLDSYQKCFRLVNPRLRYLSVVMKLPH